MWKDKVLKHMDASSSRRGKGGQYECLPRYAQPRLTQALIRQIRASLDKGNTTLSAQPHKSTLALNLDNILRNGRRLCSRMTMAMTETVGGTLSWRLGLSDDISTRMELGRRNPSSIDGA